jgi:Domain of unknown function (DUF4193)
VPTTEDDIEETEDNDDEEDLDDVDDDEDVEGALSLVDEEDDSVEESLDALRERRPSAVRRASDETEDDDDIMSLTSEKVDPSKIPLPERVDPLKDQQEFVCSRCHLVKARSQLADKDRMLCRDCV